jgi:predicted PurR-regulated permease PerM
VRGELTLVLVIGLLSFVGLTLLGIPYALPLAVIAGVMEIVPVVGPIIAAVPAIAAALLISPVFALATAALYFVIQQLENHLIVPTVMNRAVGLNPLMTIIALMIGGRLLGIGGAILAVPIVVVLKIIITDILENRPARE